MIEYVVTALCVAALVVGSAYSVMWLLARMFNHVPY